MLVTNAGDWQNAQPWEAGKHETQIDAAKKKQASLPPKEKSDDRRNQKSSAQRPTDQLHRVQTLALSFNKRR
jgi:hypothetical protein